jgi:hypothetical protein
MALKPGLEKQEQAEEAEAEGIQTVRRFTRTMNPMELHFPGTCPLSAASSARSCSSPSPIFG